MDREGTENHRALKKICHGCQEDIWVALSLLHFCFCFCSFPRRYMAIFPPFFLLLFLNRKSNIYSPKNKIFICCNINRLFFEHYLFFPVVICTFLECSVLFGCREKKLWKINESLLLRVERENQNIWLVSSVFQFLYSFKKLKLSILLALEVKK